jgi:carboxypeptidase C (cathepsin A)
MSIRTLSLALITLPIILASAEPPVNKEAKGNETKETKAQESAEKPKGEPKEKPEDKPKLSETSHSVTVNGTSLDYTATAGTLPIKDAEGKTTANIFYIAYTRVKTGSKTPVATEDRAHRPITFAFNGGPGSSSVWMHMGLLGPKRVKLAEDGSALPPPYSLVDNEWSLLDETDLVFIDPVGTGYSRATKPDEAKKFWGVQEDAQSVAEFIRLYVTTHERWTSPKFLIGESYGTTRAAALSGELATRHRMNLNGIMLLSTVLNFQTIWGGKGNDLPHVLYLPSYTAVAWHHKKLAADLQAMPLPDVLKIAEEFATHEYNHALIMGTALSAADRRAVLAQMARLTGLSASYLDRADLRPGLQRFAGELLRDKGLQVGRFDGRYTSYLRDRLSDGAETDPSGDAVFSVFASTFNDYVRGELKFEEDKPYEILGGIGKWNWGAENEFVDVTSILATAMTRNPFLKVHVSCGYTDMATPYFATRYTFQHMGLPEPLRKNLSMDDYSAGHMMYLNLSDLKKQKADLAKFIREACGQ